MPWQHLRHALQMRLCVWDHLQSFLLSHHLDKVSSLSHQSINSSKTLLAHLCAFLQTLVLLSIFGAGQRCSICNSVSKSPEDSRLSEHHPSFLEVVADFTDMSFRVRFHSFYDLSVINYCCFLRRSGSCWLLVSLVASKLLISPCPLFLL